MPTRVLVILSALFVAACGCGEEEPTDSTAEGSPFAMPEHAAPALATRHDRTCSVEPDHRVRCWGDPELGQEGPVALEGVDDAAQVALGDRRRCVLRRGGTVTCEGERVGATPEQLAAIEGVRAITGEDRHFCALDEAGAVWCWGSASTLGREGLDLAPVAIEGLPPSVSISASTSHTCALDREGAVRCWGRGFFGGLGTGASDEDSAEPLAIEGVARAIAIDASYDVSCALTDGGEVWCWGRGPVRSTEEGTLGAGRVATVEGAVDLSVSDTQLCVLDGEGGVRCGTAAGLSEVEGVDGATEVVAGRSHACARRADGEVRCWGARDRGQLGEPIANPALPGAPALRDVARVTGGRSIVAWQSDGTARGLDGEEVEVARGADAYVTGPRVRCGVREGEVRCVHSAMGGRDWVYSEPHPHPELGEVEALAFARVGGCAIAGGEARCFALAPMMGAADPPFGLAWSEPWSGRGEVPAITTRVVPELRGVVELVGAEHSLVARMRNGEVRTGLGPFTPVPALRGATALAAEGDACAVKGGRVACWSDEDDPIVLAWIDGVETATQISVHAGTGCARLEDGRAACWGDNEFGALGDGTREEREGAVIVGGAEPVTGVVAVAVAERVGCVLLEDHTLRCFGAADGVAPPEPATTAVVVPAI